MKTFSLNNKVSSYILLLALGLLAVSCGSYNETSYYGNDGIYSRRGGEQMVETSQRTSYFADFPVYNVPEDNEPVGIFTDIDSYYGDETYSTGYSGWGNSTNDVTVNVYGGAWYGGGLGWYGGWGWGNPYWGMGWGWNSWGWNSWHNPYWGWGGGYGWGWNSWHNPYWGGGYYPYYNNVAYYRGTRGGYYSSDYAYRNRSFTNTNNVRSNSRAYEVRGRNDNATRSNSRFETNSSRGTTLGTSRSGTLNNNRNSTINNSRNNTINNSRNNTINNSRNNTINNSRNNTINNSNRNSSSTPNRSGSINSGSSRSSSMGSGSSGGSRSSGMGGGGGSRSSGGGRR